MAAASGVLRRHGGSHLTADHWGGEHRRADEHGDSPAIPLVDNPIAATIWQYADAIQHDGRAVAHAAGIADCGADYVVRGVTC